MAEEGHLTCPAFSFTSHPSVSAFTVPYKTYLTNNSPIDYHYVASGALVFSRNSPGATGPAIRLLIVQRAAHDSMPNRWETPGGACDPEDQSILHAVARELWEEAGLVATSIGPRVGGDQVFLSGSGKRVGKFSFLVDVQGNVDRKMADAEGEDGDMQVKLDPNEHQRYLWVTEDEAREGHTHDEQRNVIELAFTTKEQRDVVLEGFKVWRELYGTPA